MSIVHGRVSRPAAFVAAAATVASLGTLAITSPAHAGLLMAPVTTASFSPDSISAGTSSTLTFVIANVDAGTVTNARFSVALPAGLAVATPNGVTTACDSAAVDASADGSTIVVAGVDVTGESPCTISLDVAGTTASDYVVTTSSVISDDADPGDPATANLTVTGVRGCRSYTGEAYIGAVVLNPDGTPIGCGVADDAAGAPSDLTPAGWPATGADFGQLVSDYNWGGTALDYAPRLGFACDDCSVGADGVDGAEGLPIGFPINFYGTTYNDLFVNSNGSISFGAGSDNYDQPLNDVLDGQAGVVAYGMDLYNGDVANPLSTWGAGRQPDFFYWGRTTYDGHTAFAATWMNMQGCCNESADASEPRATFQIMLVDAGDGNGDVNIVLNYGSIDPISQGYNCDSGASRCLAAGLGTVDTSTGHVSYASLVDDDGVIYNGLTATDTADDGTHPMSQAHLNSAVPGRFQFEMRDGALPQTATVPGAVANLTSTMTDSTTAQLSWDAPSVLGGSPILQYEVRYRVAGSADAWNDDAPSTTSDTLTVDPDTRYEYQVAATNGVGTGSWSTLAYFGANPPAGGGTPTPAPQPVQRLAGNDRFETASVVSQTEYPTAASAGAVVLARADDYPDALVGAPLAAADNGPLLFTTGASLPDSTKAEITRVLPQGRTVYLLGNTGAIPASIATQLSGMGYTVVRFGGANRFETAVAVAHALGDPSTVLLATGANFADALASGPAAASVHGAVLLTGGAQLPKVTADYLAAHPGTVYAIGGPAAAADPKAIAVMGANRYATAAVAAAKFFATPTTVGVASGAAFADGLPAGAFLAHTGGPLLLTDPAGLPSDTGNYLAGAKGSVQTSNTFGGPASMSAGVLSQIASALGQ